MKAKLIKTEKGYHLDTGSFDGIHLACYPHDVTKQRLSLKNCQAIENGYDLEHICWQLFGGSFEARNVESEEEADKVVNFGIECFQKALELMGDKKFSEEDVISMIEKSRETGLTAQFLMLTKQQTEWEVFVEMEDDKDVLVDDIKEFLSELGDKPKLDADGCLILKRI